VVSRVKEEGKTRDQGAVLMKVTAVVSELLSVPLLSRVGLWLWRT
jgi:hypothetical protein